MKLRESGMPGAAYWESLFDVPLIIERFGFRDLQGDVAELGCGYGTFTLPVARAIGGSVHAFDIDEAMVESTRARAREARCSNIRVGARDVLKKGFDVATSSCEAVLLFNILHAEQPVELLREAARVLRPNGFVAVIHWRTDVATPRGPSAAIRPVPDQIDAWAAGAGGLRSPASWFDLPPWHYGGRFLRESP